MFRYISRQRMYRWFRWTPMALWVLDMNTGMLRRHIGSSACCSVLVRYLQKIPPLSPTHLDTAFWPFVPGAALNGEGFPVLGEATQGYVLAGMSCEEGYLRRITLLRIACVPSTHIPCKQQQPKPRIGNRIQMFHGFIEPITTRDIQVGSQ